MPVTPSWRLAKIRSNLPLLRHHPEGVLRVKRRYDDGLDDLKERSSVPLQCPTVTVPHRHPPDVVGTVIHLQQHYHFGPMQITITGMFNDGSSSGRPTTTSSDPRRSERCDPTGDCDGGPKANLHSTFVISTPKPPGEGAPKSNGLHLQTTTTLMPSSRPHKPFRRTARPNGDTIAWRSQPRRLA